jgi:hypothetical protein
MKLFVTKKKVKYTLFFQIILVLLTILSVTGCVIKDKIEDVTNVIENSSQSTESVLRDAIEMINSNSNAWQEAIKEAQTKLTSDTQSTIRNELNDVLQRGIAATGAEMRCNTDFIADRVKISLERILARIAGQELPRIIPGICDIVPLAIDRVLIPQRLNRMEFYGYDFDQAEIKTVMIDNRERQIDISRHMSKPTHYHMVLNLGGNGVQLTDNSQKIKLNVDNNILSEIPIIQESIPICQSKIEILSNISPIIYRPPHKEGDKDFYGHGPQVNSSVRLYVTDTKVTVKLYMKARETKHDWTRAEGSKIYPFFTAPNGWKIDSIEGETFMYHSYLDDDHSNDQFDMGPGGLVKRIIYQGDRRGKDSGVYTQMKVYFNPVRIKLTQVGDCVSEKTLQRLESKNLISPQKLNTIRIRRGGTIVPTP